MTTAANAPHRATCVAQILISSLFISGAGLCAADTDHATLGQLPAPVQATLNREAKGATVSGIETEMRDGVAVYTAEIPGAKAGTIVEFSVTADGKLLTTEIEDISDVPACAAAITTLGDLTTFRTLGEQTLHLVEKKDFPATVKRIADLESVWDKAEATLRPKNSTDWRLLDKAIDKALSQVRADKPDVDGCTKALKTMIGLCPIPVAAGK